jgi:alpha-L-fucosidase 2
MRLFFFLLCSLGSVFGFTQTENRIWYEKPAARWTEALPLGNGRLGAMVFGGVDDELLQLNESSLWSGGPVLHHVNDQAPFYLALCRNALLKNEFDSAEYYAKKMQGLYSESYLPLADFTIHQSFKSNDSVKGYSRELNIGDAVSVTRFTRAGIHYKREVFISAPAQLIVIRIQADKPKQLTLDFGLKSQLHFKRGEVGPDLMCIQGKAPVRADPNYFNSRENAIRYTDSSLCNGMRFEVQVKAIHQDGELVVDSLGMHVKSATEMLIYISAATSFNGFDKCPDKDGKDEHRITSDYIAGSEKKSFSELLTSHLADYHHFYNRVSLKIADENEARNKVLPADLRLEDYAKGNSDHGLEVLYFNYGRYLLISSSRSPGAPANLQGIWNKELQPPWSSNYTTNINVQMNYWPVEVTNLSELSAPLTNLIEHLYITGKSTAKEFYGAQGWVVHHNSDLWALSNPVGNLGTGDPKWANWSMGANWLSRHLWEHYLYTQDKIFLRDTAYPLMKEAVRFTFDWLIRDSMGLYVTAPSFSPENVYYYTDKKSTGISMSSTMDMSIIRDLFSNTLSAAGILKMDTPFCDSIIEKQKKLYPFQVGKKGNLQEWYRDYADVEPHHRHVSHLYGLYPGFEISPLRDTLLSNAAKKTLELRGDDGTGWSLAWKVNFWARLLDGNHAYELFKKLLRLTRENATNYREGGGVYPNLFDAHPPFQIDGNFGGTAGVTEMLMQSQHNEIFLLPALPDAWSSGSVTGLLARGGFVVDISWNHHRIIKSVVTSRHGQVCHLRSMDPVYLKEEKIFSKKSGVGYELEFPTTTGKTYQLEYLHSGN